MANSQPGGFIPPANLLFLVSHRPPRRREYANTAKTVPKISARSPPEPV
jgi:hypothetical protein